MIARREEIAKEDCWDLSSIAPAQWEADWSALKSFRGRLGEGPKTLKEALETQLGLARQVEKLYAYTHHRGDEDLGDDQRKGEALRGQQLLQSFREASSWFEPELLTLPDELLD